MTKNAAIYARVSSIKQKEDNTIQSQVLALTDYAKKSDYAIPNGWTFMDDGYSGSSLQRPGLDLLRELVQEEVVDVILVYSPDRLSRKYAYQLLLEIEFQKKGVELLFLNTPKANNPEEQLSLHFKSIFAEYERAQIVERCRRGRNYKARQGNVTSIPTAPLGYDYITKNATTTPQYVVNKDAVVVKKIFSYYTEDRLSISEICRRLSLEGILSPKGLKQWCTATIRDILKNEAYVGTAYFGKTQACGGVEGRIYRTSKGEKKSQPSFARKQKPKELWIPIKVPQIISENTFAIAQHNLQENLKTASRNTHNPSVLQGLLVCGYCGGSYYKKVRTAKYSYYCCGHRLRGHDCPGPSIKQNELDNIVWSHIIQLMKNPQLIEEEILRRTQENQDARQLESEIKNLDKELARIAKSKDKLLDAYQDGESLTLDALKPRLKNLDIRQKGILKEKKSLEDLKSNDKKINNMKTHMKDLCLQLERTNELSVKEKQNVLRLLVSEVVITGNQIEIKHCIPTHDINDRNFSPLHIDGYIGLSGHL